MKSRHLIPAVVLLGLVLLFCHRGLTSRHVFIAGGDAVKAQYWYKAYTAERLRGGELPLWNPYYYAGHPFIANPETAVFYPLNLLFVVFPLATAFTVDAILHLYLAALGMYFLVHQFTRSRAAGLASAIAYGCSGYLIDRLFAGLIMHLHPAAWLPWVGCLALRPHDGPGWRKYSWAGLCWGMLILGGTPQMAYYSALCLCGYTVILLPGIRSLKPVLGLLLTLAIGFLLSAVQLAPAIEFSGLSDRAEKSFAFSTFMSYPPANFLTLLAPGLQHPGVNLNWECTGYVGVTALALALFAVLFALGDGARSLVEKFRSQAAPAASRPIAPLSRLSLQWALVLLFFVTLLLGDYTPLYRLYYQFLPGISLFRIPARAMFIVVFCTAILSGLGLKLLLEQRARAMLYGAVPVVMALVLWVTKTIWFPGRWPAAISLPLILIGGSLVPLAGLFRHGKWRRLATVIFLALLYGDLWLNFAPKVPLFADQKPEAYEYEIKIRDESEQFRVALPGGGVRGMFVHYQDLNGYTPIVLGDYFRFVHELAGVKPSRFLRHTLAAEVFDRPNPLLEQLLNLKYVVDSRGVDRTVSHFKPRAYLVEKVLVEPEPEKQLQWLRQGAIDISRVALVARDDPSLAAVKTRLPGLSLPNGEPLPGEVRITMYRPESLELTVQSDRPAYLVLSELFYPGWRVWVDGKPEVILKTNYLLRGLAVSAGRHQIRFAYAPRWLLPAALVSLSTLALVLWLGCVPRDWVVTSHSEWNRRKRR